MSAPVARERAVDAFANVLGVGRGLSSDEHAARTAAAQERTAVEVELQARELLAARTVEGDRAAAALVDQHALSEQVRGSIAEHVFSRVITRTVVAQQKHITARASYMGMNLDEATNIAQRIHDTLLPTDAEEGPRPPSSSAGGGLYDRLEHEAASRCSYLFTRHMASWALRHRRGSHPLRRNAEFGLRQVTFRRPRDEPFYWLCRYRDPDGATPKQMRRRWVRRKLAGLSLAQSARLIAALTTTTADPVMMQAALITQLADMRR